MPSSSFLMFSSFEIIFDLRGIIEIIDLSDFGCFSISLLSQLHHRNDLIISPQDAANANRAFSLKNKFTSVKLPVFHRKM